MGAESLARNYPKCPRIYRPNMFAQGQKFWISTKKRLHLASAVRGAGYVGLHANRAVLMLEMAKNSPNQETGLGTS